jgi:hypothetical protein
MKRIFLYIPLTIAFWLATVSFSAPAVVMDNVDAEMLQQKLHIHAQQLQQFAALHNASTDMAVLIDMSLPSWNKRLFIINLNTDSVILSGLCGHGQGKDYTSEKVVFSNQDGSLCTSEGRYLIGMKYKGQFGTSYKLYGLDETNSNAYERAVVFHAHPLIPDVEDKHHPACRSYGCPMASPKVFKAASEILDNSTKPLLMWIYK